jgi:hypothetical protein
MKLTPIEKNFIQKISAISGQDPKVVNDLFFSLLIATVMELYSGNEEVSIPFLFNFKIDYDRDPIKNAYKLKEKYLVETSPSLHQVLVKIKSGEKTWVEEFIKKEIVESISGILDEK